MGTERPRRVISLLDADPGLGVRLTPAERAAASVVARAEVVSFARGEHDLAAHDSADLLVQLTLEGWIMRNVVVGGRTTSLLSGPGSVARPADRFEMGSAIPFSASWSVVEPARIALVEAQILTVLSRWPGIVYTIVRRSLERQHLLALVSSIRALQHVELRLRAFMWLYAGRYGRAVEGGLVLPVRLSHQQLADLVGSQRPSVSAHLATLADRGEVVRCADRTWMVRGSPPAVLDDLRVRADGEKLVEL